MRLLIAILAVLWGGFFSPAFADTCPFSLAQEKAKWVQEGLSIGEADAAQVIKAIEIRYGEKVDADQVFVLSKPGAPNVVLVFATKGCPHSVLVMSVDDFQAMLKTVSL